MKHADLNLMGLSNESQSAISEDVLHITSKSKFTQEDIAKAMAHHNKRHPDKADEGAQNTKAAKTTK
jgi:hypothetical protein